MRRLARLEHLLAQGGQDLGASPWLVLDQARIDHVAQAAGDRQCVHVDPVRAAEGSFGGVQLRIEAMLALEGSDEPDCLAEPVSRR